ncbi:hypothetical protein JXA40_05275 [bacterium]|nr:hypothetical protein [candidate division CSSED10-310 bacterium]
MVFHTLRSLTGRMVICVVMTIFIPSSTAQSINLADVRYQIEATGLTWSAGETSVSSIPWEHFRRQLTLTGSAATNQPVPNPLLEDMVFPERFDWRERDGCTPVKNQGSGGNCYPCWAYSLIGACESVFKINTGLDLDLSEQQLIDCNTNGYGCDGGFIHGWTALRDYGAVTETCYPYIAEDGECTQSQCEPQGWITGVYPVPFSVNSLKYALMHHGSLSCSMTVYNDFMFYTGGCYENDKMQPINHGVVIVGWDDALCDGTGAWIVRNSWGPNWGDGGVAYMKYGTCNIGRHAQWFEYSQFPVESGLHYGLFVPDISLVEGDWFILERRFGNPAPETVRFREFLLLDIRGEYWFYPDFSGQAHWTDHVLEPDDHAFDILLSFRWPAGAEGLQDIRFWGVCLDPETPGLMAWDMVEWDSL